jgi:hypothetical protein
LEKRIRDEDKPLIVEEIRIELILQFEKLKLKSMKNEENEELEEHTLYRGQSRAKCRNCGQIVHKPFQCKNRSSHNSGTRENYCSYCCKLRHVRQNCFKLKKKETRYDHKTATSKNESFTEDICICDNRDCGKYCNSFI